MYQDHYWLKKNGMLYSSARNVDVFSNDPLFTDWPGEPDDYPVNAEGDEDIRELNKILEPYGLRAGPPAPDTLRQRAYVLEADPYLRQAMAYAIEAEAAGEAGAIDPRAEELAKEARRLYYEKKREIRNRYPEA